MKIKHLSIFLLWVMMCMVAIGSPTYAQQEEPDFTLSMSRDFGYASGTGDIQGTFSLHIRKPENLVRVDFLIDGVTVFEDNEVPFRYQFNTDSYSFGTHTMSAVGYTQDGTVLTSQVIRRTFVSAEESGQVVLRILVPLFSIIIGLMALSYLIPILFRRGKTVPLGSRRNYGLIGGTICRNCNRPFAFNILSLNLLVGKLDRCPHCGRWSLLQRQSMDALRKAEQAELDQSGMDEKPEKILSEEERLKKALDDSRYEDI